MALPLLKNCNIRGKRVFVRADLNVPLENDKIVQDYRLENLLPTIQFIQQNGGKVILATHIGRPAAQGKTHLYDASLSTKLLVPWFTEKGFAIEYEKDLVSAHHKSKQFFNKILLLENLRFFNSERESNAHFAELLAFLGDFYINDAFAMAHRHDTSVALLPQEFNADKRGIGLLMEKEITALTKLRENKTDNLLLVIGGNKIKDKVAMLEFFFDRERHPNLKAVCIGGGIGLAFLKAQGYECGKTTIEDETIATAQHILTMAGENGINVVLPLDHKVQDIDSQNHVIITVTQKIPENAQCIDIGPKTIAAFQQEISKANMLFANGPMGICEKEESNTGTFEILKSIAQSSAYTVVGGGDTVAAAYACNIQKNIKFLSTGGGATLAFLGCENPETDLPALAALML